MECVRLAATSDLLESLAAVPEQTLAGRRGRRAERRRRQQLRQYPAGGHGPNTALLTNAGMVVGEWNSKNPDKIVKAWRRVKSSSTASLIS